LLIIYWSYSSHSSKTAGGHLNFKTQPKWNRWDQAECEVKLLSPKRRLSAKDTKWWISLYEMDQPVLFLPS